MPSIERWNPILARLHRKVPEFANLNTQTEVADLLEMDKSEISRWMRGAVMRQDKVIKIMRILRRRGISSEDIVDIVANATD